MLARLLVVMTVALTVGRLRGAPAEAAPREVERLATRGQTVAILVNPALADPLVSRIEAELTAVGIRVRRLELAPGADVEAAVGSAMAGGASAALRVIPRSRGTEVWTSDTTARVLRRRAINASSADAALSVLAFRTVEFLRASLLDVPKSRLRAGPAEPERPAAAERPNPVVATAPPPSPSPVRPPAPAASPPSPPQPLATAAPPPPRLSERQPESRPEAGLARERPDPESDDRTRLEGDRTDAREEPPVAERLSIGIRTISRGTAPMGSARSWVELQVGLAWLLSYRARQLGPATDYALAARIRLGRGLAVGAEGLIPAAAQETTLGGARTTFRAYRVGLAMAWTLPFPSGPSRFRLEAGLAVGAIYGSTHGSPDPRLGIGASTPATVVYPDIGAWKGSAALSVGPSVALTSWLRARLDFGGGLTTARIGVYQGDKTDAHTVGGLGPLYGLGSLGLQATW